MTDTPRQFTAEDYDLYAADLEDDAEQDIEDWRTTHAMLQQAADMARERERLQFDLKNAKELAALRLA